ncbi:MAG: DNA repair protein RecO [Acidobacteriota bacterium]|nr:DNA repair protein RecO [Acidobacteriota bacterium]
MQIRETEAFILRTYNLAEADKIVVCFSKEIGVLRGVAKGARRLKSKFGASLEPYTHVVLTLYEKEGRELLAIRQSEMIKSYFELATDHSALAVLDYLALLLIDISPSHEPDEKLFRLLKACLESVAEMPIWSREIALYFELWLLKLSGFMPDTRNCTQCRQSLSQGDCPVAIREGRILCQSCYHGGKTETWSPRVLKHLDEAFRLHPLAWSQKHSGVDATLRQETAFLINLLMSRCVDITQVRKKVAQAYIPLAETQNLGEQTSMLPHKT